MEPGAETEVMNDEEVLEFWRREPALELDAAGDPEIQEVGDRNRYAGSPRYLYGEGPIVFVEGSCRSTEWTRSFSPGPAEVDRVWVHVYEPRYSHMQGSEYLYVVFKQPVLAGPEIPEGFCLIPQPGRWEFINPRTLCFSPKNKKVMSAMVILDGKRFSVTGEGTK